jgi:hypothetical protein
MFYDDKTLLEILTGDETTKTICRSCLKEKNEQMKHLRSLLHLDRFLFSMIPSEINVISLYNYCAKQPVLINDGLAQHVCSTCLKKFINTYEFLHQCELAEARLQKLATYPGQKEVVYVNGKQVGEMHQHCELTKPIFQRLLLKQSTKIT